MARPVADANESDRRDICCNSLMLTLMAMVMVVLMSPVVADGSEEGEERGEAKTAIGDADACPGAVLCYRKGG